MSVLVLLDIDNTIITPVSSAFKLNNGKNIIDAIKQIMRSAESENNHRLVKECVDIISLWRLNRMVRLTDANWPSFITNMVCNNTFGNVSVSHSDVFGLTQIDSGKFGRITSMEKWRTAELQSLNIKFSGSYGSQSKPSVIFSGKTNATYSDGIFYTGSFSKGKIISYLLKSSSCEYDIIFFIDDRLDHLEDVANTCDELGMICVTMQFEIPHNDNTKHNPDDVEEKMLDIIALHYIDN